MEFSDAVNDAYLWSISKKVAFVSKDIWDKTVRGNLMELAVIGNRDTQVKLAHLRGYYNNIKSYSYEFVVDCCPNIDLRSIKASNRYYDLNELYEEHHKNFCLILLLAECHFLMQDTSGCHRLLIEAREVLREAQQKEDSLLNLAIKHVGALADLEKNDNTGQEEDYDTNDSSVQIFRYTRPKLWKASSVSSDLCGLITRWNILCSQRNGPEQFARLAYVTSNELEGVFQLQNDSSKKLARCGLILDHIIGISSASRHKDPAKILSIIQNSKACYDSLKKIVDGDLELTDEFLISMHRKLLDRDNIDIKFIRDDERGAHRAFLTPMGAYREVPCFASHPDKGYETQFCELSEILEEMKFFFEQANVVVGSNDQNPFRAAAYMQHLFLRIHPFCDGNGRIARLISSIPLLKNDL